VTAPRIPLKLLLALGLVVATGDSHAQRPTSNPAFEVATIKPVESNQKTGRYIVMQGNNRFVVKYYTLKLLIAAAYDLSPKVISGGPAWSDSDHFDIVAITPGDARPAREEQMVMLRTLLADRFKLGFHREQKSFSYYQLDVAQGGVRLKQSTAPEGDPAALISTVYPDHIHLPARNATMTEFASLLQRAVLDRPVVDSTGLQGKFDFDLDWAPDETQFGGEVPSSVPESPSPPFFVAINQQLGLHIQAKKGPISAMVVDTAQLPSPD
jgi:uncharacterized protein (TIGR03435 family)